MKPIKFPGENVVFASDQPEYLPLPAHRNPKGDVTSCWHLTWLERLRVVFTGQVFVTCMTLNKPLQPLLLELDNPVPEWNHGRLQA